MLKAAFIVIAMLSAIPVHAQIVNPLYNACLGTMPNGMDGNPPPSEGVTAWEAEHHDSFEHPCLRELAQDKRNAAQLTIHPNLDPRSYLFR